MSTKKSAALYNAYNVDDVVQADDDELVGGIGAPPSTTSSRHDQPPPRRAARADPPASSASTAATINHTTTNNVTNNNNSNVTPMEPPTLPSGEVVDAKNTVRSHTILAAAVNTTMENDNAIDKIHTRVNAQTENTSGGNTTRNRQHLPQQCTEKNSIQSSTHHLAPPTTATMTATGRQQPPVVGIPVPISYRNSGAGAYNANIHRSHNDNNNNIIQGEDTVENDPLQVLVEARFIHDAYTTNTVTPNAVAVSDSDTTPTNNNINAKRSWTLVLLSVLVVAVVAAVAIFAICGGNGCSKSPSISTTTTTAMPATSAHPPIQGMPMVTQVPAAPPVTPVLRPIKVTPNPTSVTATTPQPSLPPTPSQDHSEQVVSFINSITLSGRTIASPAEVESGKSNYTVEEQALAWIINDDPLQLVPDAPSNKFQLMQRYALRTIIVQQPVPNEWSNTSTWMLSECQWYGMECSTVHMSNDFGEQQAVTKIDFYTYDASLQGILPADIGLFSALLYIEVGDGSLHGSLPDSIGHWQNVTHVGLCCNEFSGSLPATIGNWKNVEYVALSINQLTGSLPASIGNWHSAEYVYLWNNSFTGSLPTSIGNWQNGTVVSLSSNQLTGSLPSSIGKWQNVTDVDLSVNQLTGSLPTSIGNWQSVTYVDLNNNQLTGALPTSIGNWQYVTYVSLSNNQLTGTFPDSIGTNWTKLATANLYDNMFIGTVPMDWCELTPIPYLEADCVAEVICICCTKCD